VNPPNRFEKYQLERDPEWAESEAQRLAGTLPDESPDPAPTTTFYKDLSQTIIATNDSPDVGFSASINPYRGCEHGCIYCYARPGHEYLGLSAGLDFESKIFVKHDAPELLRKALSAKSWKPQVVAISGVTDCYQPIERRLRLTRRCLEVLAEFRNPAGVITKNALVARDIDVFEQMHAYQGINVTLSVTSLDGRLTQILEPRTSQPSARLDAIKRLSAAGIPTGIMVAPVIPGINDHEIPAILEACRNAGARSAGYVLLRLPWTVAPLFESWLDAHFPERKAKVMHRIEEMRGGKKYDSRFGTRQRGEGVYAEQLLNLFEVAKRKAGFDGRDALSTASFRRPPGPQLDLFEV
jgi:DNA repair photolyase